MTQHTTQAPRKRGPKIQLPINERPADFNKLNIKMVEEYVGRPAIGMEVRGKWVVIDFANCTVSFKEWKSV